jgi:sulfatase modifying factor 1
VVVGVAACSQILGVEDVPSNSPDAGVDATKHADAGHPDARLDTGRDAGVGGCEASTKRCSPEGLGVETCGRDGGWSAPVACGATAVCLGPGICTCAPGATQCVDQQFQRCLVPDGGTPRWPDGGVGCPGTCTLSGCALTARSCGPLEAGVSGTAPDGSGVSDCLSRDGGPESCCASNETPGGTFDRSYDDYGNPNDHSPATVSPFRLDRFEVTVARFRRFFLDTPNWIPAAGSGKHTHLNGGQGLVDSAASADGGVVYESGWSADWDTDLTNKLDSIDLGQGTSCLSGVSNWTPIPGLQENLPMNCLSWEEAYAFCIWDSGFLPSEAEWNYAAAGGSEQRIYPWSPSLEVQKAMDGGGPNAAIDCNHAHYEACPFDRSMLGKWLPLGDSKWLQANMAGDVDEWALDVYSSAYNPSCTDCARFGQIPDGSTPIRVRRGGSFLSVASEVQASYRGYDSQTDAPNTSGVRCARVP